MGLVSGDTRLREGGCHCGSVRFTVALPQALTPGRCNCSICSMKGAVMVGAPAEALAITEGADLLSVYRFNTMAAEHNFCSRCGIHLFHKRRLDPTQVGINVACLVGVSPFDFAEVQVTDGVHHPLDSGGVVRRAGVLRFEADEG